MEARAVAQAQEAADHTTTEHTRAERETLHAQGRAAAQAARRAEMEAAAAAERRAAAEAEAAAAAERRAAAEAEAEAERAATERAIAAERRAAAEADDGSTRSPPTMSLLESATIKARSAGSVRADQQGIFDDRKWVHLGGVRNRSRLTVFF